MELSFHALYLRKLEFYGNEETQGGNLFSAVNTTVDRGTGIEYVAGRVQKKGPVL